jgi:hypothetical protein
MSPNVNNNLNSTSINNGSIGYQKDDSAGEISQMGSLLKDMTLNAVGKYQEMSGAAKDTQIVDIAKFQLPVNVKVAGLTVNVTR